MSTKTKPSDTEMLARIDADIDEPAGPVIDGAALRRVAQAVKDRAAAEEAVEDAVAAARAEGLSWGVIGAALGVSRQGALKRYGKG